MFADRLDLSDGDLTWKKVTFVFKLSPNTVQGRAAKVSAMPGETNGTEIDFIYEERTMPLEFPKSSLTSGSGKKKRKFRREPRYNRENRKQHIL